MFSATPPNGASSGILRRVMRAHRPLSDKLRVDPTAPSRVWRVRVAECYPCFLSSNTVLGWSKRPGATFPSVYAATVVAGPVGVAFAIHGRRGMTQIGHPGWRGFAPKPTIALEGLCRWLGGGVARHCAACAPTASQHARVGERAGTRSPNEVLVHTLGSAHINSDT